MHGHIKKQDARFLHPVIQRNIRHKAVEMFLSGILKLTYLTIMCK